MKSLVFGVVLIILIGVGGFLYRNVLERTGGEYEEPVACTADAKICPDGSGVGREGPRCEFSACPFPNVELDDARISFVVPTGYRVEESADSKESSLIASFVKDTLSEGVFHRIRVHRFSIEEGSTGEDTILLHTRYQPADMEAEDFKRFETILLSGKEFRTTVIERFEAQVVSAYYLVRENDVLLFEITEHDVTDWTNETLVIKELPEHKTLLTLLETLELQ